MGKEPLKVLTESMFYVLVSLLRQERIPSPPAGCPWDRGRCIRSWENFRRSG